MDFDAIIGYFEIVKEGENRGWVWWFEYCRLHLNIHSSCPFRYLSGDAAIDHRRLEVETVVVVSRAAVKWVFVDSRVFTTLPPFFSSSTL